MVSGLSGFFDLYWGPVESCNLIEFLGGTDAGGFNGLHRCPGVLLKSRFGVFPSLLFCLHPFPIDFFVQPHRINRFVKTDND